MRTLLPAASLLALCSCGDDIVEAAKERVSYELFDPSSAQFRDMSTGGGVVCGQVNGKNRFGAYVGFRDFYAVRGVNNDFVITIVDPETLELMPESERGLTESIFAGMRARCNGDDVAERQAEIDGMQALCDRGQNQDACDLADDMRAAAPPAQN